MLPCSLLPLSLPLQVEQELVGAIARWRLPPAPPTTLAGASSASRGSLALSLGWAGRPSAGGEGGREALARSGALASSGVLRDAACSWEQVSFIFQLPPFLCAPCPLHLYSPGKQCVGSLF